MKELNNIHQQTAEWLEAKLGKVGGTSLKDVVGSNNLTLIDELIAEIGSGLHEGTFKTDAMQRGIDLEPTVKLLFTEIHGIEMDNIGLCIHDEYDMFCLSPDGYSKCRTIGLEIKCPGTKKHVQYIRMNKIPAEYKWQIVAYFFINEKCEKVYFVTFDDRYKPKPYFEIIVKREELAEQLALLDDEVPKFIEKFNNYKNQVES